MPIDEMAANSATGRMMEEIAESLSTATGRHKSIRFWLWLVVILLCLNYGSIRLWQNYQGQARLDAWRNEYQATLQLGNRLGQLYSSQHHSKDQPSMTKADLAAVLKDEKPMLVSVPTGYNGMAQWRHPANGIVFEFGFDSIDGWSSMAVDSGLSRPPAPAFDQFTHSVQCHLGQPHSVGTAFWIVTFISCMVGSKERKILAEVLLAMSLVSITSWLTWPDYLSPADMFSIGMISWAAVMLLLSVALVYFSRRRVSSPPWPACSKCSYNLTGNVSGICPECGEKI